MSHLLISRPSSHSIVLAAMATYRQGYAENPILDPGECFVDQLTISSKGNC
jgi:hypothetical protein